MSSYLFDILVVLMFVGFELYYYKAFTAFQDDVNGRLDNIESLLYSMDEQNFSDKPDEDIVFHN